MYDIRSLNIWKQEPESEKSKDAYLAADISELVLSVRAFNCLKRAGCNTVQDIYSCMGEDGQGLRKIRNLGSTSENEICEKLKELEQIYQKRFPAGKSAVERVLVKPPKKALDKEITQFHLSDYAYQRLTACGIHLVRDLYATNPKNEPGWYAVRELFEKIMKD